MSPPARAPRQPIFFGNYELLERIKVGGMAEVLKARPRSGPEDSFVAIKRILPHLTSDKQYVAMFLDESRVLARLTHAGIVRTLEVGQVDDVPFIALEYVFGPDGRALLNRARRRVPTPIHIACYVIAEVCAALHYAHEARDDDGRPLGLVHRDVSLQNILLSYDGDVKLTDFGIAIGAHSTTRTEAGMVKGNLGYVSPEQLQGLPADRRSDVFAAGICLYELLTNRRLFGGANDYASITKLRYGAVTPPRLLNPEIPLALEELVLRAIAKRPEDRFQSAGEMRDALLAVTAEADQHGSPSELGAHLRTLFASVVRAPSGSTAPASPIGDPGESQAKPEEDGPASGVAPSEPPWGDRSASDVFERAPRRIGKEYGSAPTVLQEHEPAAASPRPEGGPSAASGDFPRAPASRVQPVAATNLTRGGRHSDSPASDAVFLPLTGSAPTPHGAGPRTQPIAYGAVVGAVAAIIAIIVIALYVHSRNDPAEIHLSISPRDAAVWLDGRRIAPSDPMVLSDLAPGVPHRIEVSKPGYRSWTARLSLAPKQVLELPAVVLVPMAPPPTRTDEPRRRAAD